MHTDVTDRHAITQWAGVRRTSEARQHQPATHQFGDAAESDDEPGGDRAQSERRLVEHWERLYQGEDALMG